MYLIFRAFTTGSCLIKFRHKQPTNKYNNKVHYWYEHFHWLLNGLVTKCRSLFSLKKQFQKSAFVLNKFCTGGKFRRHPNNYFTSCILVLLKQPKFLYGLQHFYLQHVSLINRNNACFYFIVRKVECILIPADLGFKIVSDYKKLEKPKRPIIHLFSNDRNWFE